MAIQFHTLTLTFLQSHCYIVWDDSTGEAAVIDPGGEAEIILQAINERGLKVRWILDTHGHIDHIGANVALREATGAPIWVHEADAPMLSSSVLCGAIWLGIPFTEHRHDFLLAEGETVGEGTLQFKVIHTPGHSPGSVMLYLPEPGLLFSGDLVILGAIGRTDLPGGDPEALDRSIREKFLTLPDSTRVMPGHGAETTIGRERVTNPFVAAQAR